MCTSFLSIRVTVVPFWLWLKKFILFICLFILKLFNTCIENSEKTDDLDKRLQILLANCTSSVYTNVARWECYSLWKLIWIDAPFDKKVPKSRLSVSRQDQHKVIAVSLLSELENRRVHLTVVGVRYWKQSKVSEVFSQNGSVAPYWGLNPRPLSRLCGVFVWLLSNSCFVLKEERRTFDLFSIVYAENLQFLWVLVTSFQCMPLIRLKGLNTHPYSHGFTPINTSLTSLKTLT